MKFLCLVFLFNICFCAGGEESWWSEREKYWRDIIYGDRGYGVKDTSKEKDKDPIARPCSNDDWNCIGSFFARNSLCPGYGHVADPYELDAIYLDIPHSELSVIVYNAKVKGFSSGKIKEFYIVKESNTVVLEVTFESIIVESPKTVIKHYRKGKEPLDVKDSTVIEFKSLSLTLTITSTGYGKWNTHVYAELTDDMPYTFGPKITDSKDLDVIRHNKKFLGNMPLSAREAFTTSGPVFMSLFLQNKVCSSGYH